MKNEQDVITKRLHAALLKSSKEIDPEYVQYLMFQILGALILTSRGRKVHKSYIQEQIKKSGVK